jgi:hypothetical protein
MEAVAPRQLADAELRGEDHVAHADLTRVEFDHHEQPEVVETGRDGRHPDHVEVADLEELGDQEGGGAEHRRRQDGAQSAGGEQAAGRVLGEPRLGQHRIGDGADHHRRGDAGAGRAAEQERGEHDGAAGAIGLAAHGGEREIDEEIAGAGAIEKGAVDREQDDQRRRHVDRHAEDALQRDEEVTDQARDVISAMGPGRRQVRPDHGVDDEKDGDGRHDPAGRATRRLQQDDDEDDAEHDVELERHRCAVGEVFAAIDRISDDGDGGDRRHHVPPADAVAILQRHRKQQEREHQHEGDVRVAQVLRVNDGRAGKRPGAGDGHIEMKQRRCDRDRGDDHAGPAGKPVGGAFLLLDELLGLAQGVRGDGRLFDRLDLIGHAVRFPSAQVGVRSPDFASLHPGYG